MSLADDRRRVPRRARPDGVLDLEIATEFLLIAATLIELKARRLLPTPRGPRARRGAAAASRSATCSSPGSSTCKTFKDAAGGDQLRSCASRTAAWPAGSGPRSRSGRWCPTRSSGSGRASLRDAARRALEAPPEPQVEADHIAPIRASVAEAIAAVLDAAAPRTGRCRSGTSPGDAATRLEVIVRFLAVLELYKQGVVDLDQADDVRRTCRCGALTTGEALDASSIADWDNARRDAASRAPVSRGRRCCAAGPATTLERPAAPSRRCSLAATEPVEPRFLAELVELPGRRTWWRCAPSSPTSTSARARVRARAASRAATGSRPTPTSPPYVERFVLEGQHVRLSGPALETLAIVAYKQPISRAQVSAIRGVDVESTLQTLDAARLRRRGGPRPRAGPRGAVRDDDGVPRAARARLARRRCRRSATSCPTPASSQALERGLRVSDDPTSARSRPSPVDG